MKTYFLSWETKSKKGHACYDFDDGVSGREALKRMLEFVTFENQPPENDAVVATQFNLVEAE